jgi:predicted  nucleic acid-binding Zn-ribbon protein
MAPPRFDLSDPDAVYFCAHCGSPYARRVEQCITCGHETFLGRDEAEQAAANDGSETNADVEFAELVVSQNDMEADKIRDALYEAGIRFAETPDDTVPVLIPAAGRPTRFAVPKDELARADAVLDAIEGSLDVPADELEDGFGDEDDEGRDAPPPER